MAQRGPRPREPARDGNFAKKTLELLDNNVTSMRTIPIDSGFANKPSDVSTFNTGRSLGVLALAGTAADGIGRLRRAT